MEMHTVQASPQQCRVGVHPNSIGAPPRQQPSSLISRLELGGIPIQGGISPNSTTLICQKGHTLLGQGGDKCGQEKGAAHILRQQQKEGKQLLTAARTTLNFAKKINLRLLTKGVGLK